MASTKLIIIRHGETEQNRNNILQGAIDTQLSELGLFQAEKVAQRLKDEKIDVLVSSHLQRAVKTAEAIARQNTYFQENKDQILVDKAFREISYGVMDGRNRNEIFDDKRLLLGALDQYNFKYENGESIRDVHLRIKRALKKLLKEHEGKTIAIVTHGMTKRTMIMELLAQSLTDVLKHMFRNTAVSMFTLQKTPEDKRPYGSVVTEVFNCAKHMEEDL